MSLKMNICERVDIVEIPEEDSQRCFLFAPLVMDHNESQSINLKKEFAALCVNTKL